jgi:GH24 family phage-related lysozyme (muramidase)
VVFKRTNGVAIIIFGQTCASPYPRATRAINASTQVQSAHVPVKLSLHAKSRNAGVEASKHRRHAVVSPAKLIRGPADYNVAPWEKPAGVSTLWCAVPQTRASSRKA